MTAFALDLVDEQAGAVAKAVSVAERIWCGDFAVVADLADEGLLVGPEGEKPADIDDMRGILTASVNRFREAARVHAGVPIFAGEEVGYDPDGRLLPQDRLSKFCEALDLFVRIGLGQLTILDEVGRSEVFAQSRSGYPDRELDQAKGAIDLVKLFVGHRPNASHSIGSPHLDVVYKRAYEVMKVARRHQVELSDDTEMWRTVHGDGLTVRYTQDPAPAIGPVPPPTPKP